MNEYMIVLTKVKKFKRKFYSKKLNRSFPFDGVLYAIGFGVGMYLLRHMPGLYIFFSWIPFMIAYLVIPVGLAYLLTRSEERRVGNVTALARRESHAYRISFTD